MDKADTEKGVLLYVQRGAPQLSFVLKTLKDSK